MLEDHIPNKFTDFIINKAAIRQLTKWNKNTVMHTLIYGKKNVGKRTLMLTYIKYLFNLDVLDTKLVKYCIKINNNMVEINCLQSTHHFEINLHEYGLYDRHVICKFVKELAETKDITGNYKIIFLDRFDEVSLLAQWALRRMMETLSASCRFFLTANSVSKIDNPIISRCFCVRVGYPTDMELYTYINYTSDKLNLNISKNRQKFIIENCPKDLYKLNIMIRNPNIKNINPLDKYIKTIHKILISKKLLFLDEIRPIIYKLHLLDFKVAEIIREYIKYSIQNKLFNDNQLIRVIEAGALNEHKSNITNRIFFCLEKFFIVIKSIINNLS